MKNKKKILCILWLSVTTATAQTAVEKVLQQIEANNTTLSAVYDELEAQKLQNKTGLNLPNPEVEFAYLWGSPSGMPGRTDMSVTQEFDWTVLLGHRRRTSEYENEMIELKYRQTRIDVLLEAKQRLIELNYYNTLCEAMEKRREAAQQLLQLYQKKMESGETNILETNKVQLDLSLLSNEMELLEIERRTQQQELQRLNGGIPLNTDAELLSYGGGLPSDFEEWYGIAEKSNPMLKYVRKEVELNKEKVEMNRVMGLPVVTAGYTSELIKGSNYRGLSVGLSIPLWENKNRVKQAKAALQASENRMGDARLQFYLSLKILYDKVQGMRQAAQRGRKALDESGGLALWKKALTAGEISLTDYLQETEFYYTRMERVLQAERDYAATLAELQAVEL